MPELNEVVGDGGDGDGDVVPHPGDVFVDRVGSARDRCEIHLIAKMACLGRAESAPHSSRSTTPQQYGKRTEYIGVRKNEACVLSRFHGHALVFFCLCYPFGGGCGGLVLR